ncbi:MAG: response regulator transcription factor [Candidatus Riflebacteria bacterium]|nr:response regulator transcription factor [Candidatus Riflebacteria bacterium]
MSENTVIIADDHKIVREGLRTLLDKLPGFKVIGEACDGSQAFERACELQPDCIIMDISMPVLNGLEASRQILQKFPHQNIIALSMHSDRRFVLEALKIGIKGYLLKDSAFEELHLAIKTVMNNQIFLSLTISDMLAREFIKQSQSQFQPESSSSAFVVLSPREREILQLFAEGRSTKEIAGHLNISVKTIETHRKQIMDKLNIHSIAELTKYAIREGLTSL